MTDLMLVLSSVMPREMMVQKLEEELLKYKENPTDETWKTLEMFCALVVAKAVTEPKGEETKEAAIINAMEDMAKVKKAGALMGIGPPHEGP